MTLDEFREIAYARPFTTFVIHLKDGRQLRVCHQMATMIRPDHESLMSFASLEDPPHGRERAINYRFSEIDRIELRPDLPRWDIGEDRWMPSAG